MSDSQSTSSAAFDRAEDVRTRIQGEVLVVGDACVVLADAAWPMSDLAKAEAGNQGAENGLIVVPHPVDLVVLLTQTCDLQDTDQDHYLCQVAPVLENVAETFAHEVARGRRPGWVSLPWHHQLSVGDLSRITTIERSVIVGAESRGHPRTSAERLHLAESISRHLTRAALPDAVSRVLAPILRRMQDRHDRQSPEGQCIARVASVRVEAAPELDAETPDLTVLFVLDAVDLPSLSAGSEARDAEVDRLVESGIDAAARAALAATDEVARREAWQALTELWVQPAAQAVAEQGSGVGTVDVEVLNGDELSFARSRNAREVDLAHLSTRAA